MPCPKCGSKVEIADVKHDNRSVTAKTLFKCTNPGCDFETRGDF